MKSKKRKRITAIVLCMVLMLSTGISAIAEAEPSVEDQATVAEQETVGTENLNEEKTEIKEEETTSIQQESPKETVQDQLETSQEEALTEETEKVPEEENMQNTQEMEKKKGVETTETNEAAEVQEQQKEIDHASEKEAVSPSELIYENKDKGLHVTVLAIDQNAIPSDASLQVVPISEDDRNTAQQYKEVDSKVQENAKGDGAEVKGFLAYDISLVDSTGAEIAPNGEVKVTIAYDKATLPGGIDSEISKETETNILHLKEDDRGKINDVVDMGKAGKIDVLKTTDAKQIETVSVKTDSFSPYVITWTYYKKDYTPKFYYVYVSPDTEGGYKTDLLWKGENFPESDNLMGLKESDSESKNEVRRRYGFGSGDNSLSKVQKLTDTVKDNESDQKGEKYREVEFVGARLYDKNKFGDEGKYDFSTIHNDGTYITYLKEGRDGFEYSTQKSATDFSPVTDQDVVFLFSDVIDRSVLNAGQAAESGLIVDLSDEIKGDGKASVKIEKSAEWENYAERIANINFTLSGTPTIKPLDIILVIDSSYSMDFSNYDWDYKACSTDVSSQQYGNYERYARFFDGKDVPNKLNGTSRMAATKYAAYSVAATFLKNNVDIEEENKKNRIAVVDFNEKVAADENFDSNYTSVTNRIENIKTNAGTHTGGAIEKADNLAKKSKDENRTCITIVLSDGAPTIGYPAFETKLSDLHSKSSVYTIGVDLSDQEITDPKGLEIPGTGKTQRDFFNSIASDESKAYNADSYSSDGSGTNVIQECFNSIIADLTTVAENAVIHDIISQYFGYHAPVPGGNISNENKNVDITVGEISAWKKTYNFQVKIDDRYKDQVDSYLTNQNDSNDPKDVYVSYKVDGKSDSTPVTEDPDVPVYHELKVEYYYYDEEGKAHPIQKEGNPYIQRFIDSKVFQEKGSEPYRSYGKLEITESSDPTFTMTKEVRDAGLEGGTDLQGYHFEKVESTLKSDSDIYTLDRNNNSNVIKVYYAKDYPWQIVKKSSSDNGNGPVLQGAEFSLTLQEANPTIQYTGISDGDGVVQWQKEGTPVTSADFTKGTYTLKETKAPEGYSKNEKTWTITISNKGSKPTITCDGTMIKGSADENDIYEFTYLNDAVYSLPSSGGPGIFWYTIGGVLLMMAGTLILYKIKNREVLKR